MSNYQDKFDKLIQKLKQNMNRLLATQEVPLSKASSRQNRLAFT
jgi:hypothetical protein